MRFALLPLCRLSHSMEDFSYLLGQHDLNGQVQNHATQLPALPSLSPFESEMFWSQTGAGSDWNGSLEATIDARALENAPGLVEKSGNASNGQCPPG